MSRQDSHDVIVIGAGASGLAAAAALRAAGRDVVALEARNRIGARLLSAPAERPGRALDLGDILGRRGARTNPGRPQRPRDLRPTPRRRHDV
ncbi:NAD(P)-binding protein [Streptomyces scabiei]|nr:MULTISPECIES: FAD-dependent oxidoreductase [Streptomyces]MDW8478161.1 NAD(P)-binding protein [Streptomyces scabiei]MDX2568266.1 NAD(P)-binding protein [Streptomyces scabiei]MDX2625670.1 NAD(P)-binding protein [Streptomyces scabiei]MDX2685262.1 NAD(P)-binding protein [Streptomyces scabiei]MDX2750255.1 NAD(P)-binding protein [Streptomyces scabiei]